MTTRVSPPVNKLGVNPCTVFGRTYNVAVGSTQDVPDQDAQQLGYNGWFLHGIVVTTATRPNPLTVPKGTIYIDTTLNAAIICDSTQWRNLLTGAVT
jgi:hypothetical protein